tara:strand:+ start:1320 stop:1727 length:408 start_codon:yes stop_codon:yes gene_type:complete
MNKSDKINHLKILPVNFRHEKKYLIKNNLDAWEKLRNLTDSDINKILKSNSLCTQSRLIKIRAISIFIIDLELAPYEAYLLLHSGIGSIKSLSILDPHNLQKKISRLQRNLNLDIKLNTDLTLLKGWISKAKELS